MTEFVPTHIESHESYDRTYSDRAKARQLATGVLYTLLLELKNDTASIGRYLVELKQAPTFSAAPTENSAYIDLYFKDDDARTQFCIPAIVRDDEVSLPWIHLVIGEEDTLDHGYFLESVDGVREVFQKPPTIDTEDSTGTQNPLT